MTLLDYLRNRLAYDLSGLFAAAQTSFLGIVLAKEIFQYSLNISVIKAEDRSNLSLR